MIIRGAGGAVVREATGGSVARWVEVYLEHLQARKLAANSLRAYRLDLGSVGAALAEITGTRVAELPVAEVTATELRSAFARHAAARSASSVTRAWSTWNGFFGFLVVEGAVGGNPMQVVPKPRSAPPTPKPLQGEDTPERLLRLVAEGGRRARNPWPERDLAVLAVLLCTGVRSAELLDLTVASLAGRPGDRRLHVRGKGGKNRSIPIEGALDEVVGAYLSSRRVRFGDRLPGAEPLFVDHRGEPLRRGGLQYLVRQSLRAAGISDRVQRGAMVHALRHTFATRLAEDGANAAEIAKLLGHASINSSQTYIDVTAREQRMSVRANRTHQVLTDLAPRRAPRGPGRPAGAPGGAGAAPPPPGGGGGPRRGGV
ncbi:tyrosine-type recombinase/integrase [Saccharopolyspora sp. 6V]|uniref:tyrosine-type recombinase/integrase n=2 Tax=Saccharopolyspora TaxID=1835 RepID=UPI001CD3460E|nr:tyrosine-type recombinase/integrase [Saccharopolyspora sp. 6V]MCA1193032.1 tyrosine-type recombinase/integrase [Saccharopolyspora sp. 6V]